MDILVAVLTLGSHASVDACTGGHVDMEMKDFTHHFGAGFVGGTRLYGYSLLGDQTEAETGAALSSFPGPTILAQVRMREGRWGGNVVSPHLLHHV